MYVLMYILCMSHRYSIAEARSQLPTIVSQAESGLEVELTRRGQPVAVVVSRREFERLRGRRQHFGDAYRRFLATYALEDIGVEMDFAESTRDRTTGRAVKL
jgi:prevent-host-death family protein